MLNRHFRSALLLLLLLLDMSGGGSRAQEGVTRVASLCGPGLCQAEERRLCGLINTRACGKQCLAEQAPQFCVESLGWAGRILARRKVECGGEGKDAIGVAIRLRRKRWERHLPGTAAAAAAASPSCTLAAVLAYPFPVWRR